MHIHTIELSSRIPRTVHAHAHSHNQVRSPQTFQIITVWFLPFSKALISYKVWNMKWKILQDMDLGKFQFHSTACLGLRNCGNVARAWPSVETAHDLCVIHSICAVVESGHFFHLVLLTCYSLILSGSLIARKPAGFKEPKKTQCYNWCFTVITGNTNTKLNANLKLTNLNPFVASYQWTVIWLV